MNYQIGDEVIVEMTGTVCKIEKGCDNMVYYTVEYPSHYEYARVRENALSKPITPEDLKCQS